jgi:cytochrome c556
MRIFGAAILAASCFVVTLPAVSQSPAEDAIKYRQGVFQGFKWHFGPLVAMVKGELDYDQVTALHHANAIAALSKTIHEGFAAGSGPGENTAALAAVWEKPSEFKAATETAIAGAAALVASVETGEAQSLGAGVGGMGQACKGCHDNFRKK